MVLHDCVRGCFACVYVCVSRVCLCQQRYHEGLWNWNYRVVSCHVDAD